MRADGETFPTHPVDESKRRRGHCAVAVHRVARRARELVSTSARRVGNLPHSRHIDRSGLPGVLLWLWLLPPRRLPLLHCWCLVRVVRLAPARNITAHIIAHNNAGVLLGDTAAAVLSAHAVVMRIRHNSPVNVCRRRPGHICNQRHERRDVLFGRGNSFLTCICRSRGHASH